MSDEEKLAEGNLAAAMGKLSMEGSVEGSDKRPSLYRKRTPTREMVAFVTVGRWQGPHMGHFLLINELYRKAIEIKEAEAFVYVTDKITVRPDSGWVHDNWEEYNSKNPLTGIQKLYYLSLMFPKDRYSEDKFKFLVGFNQDNIMRGLLNDWTKESYPYRISKSWSTDNLKLLYNTNPNDGFLSPDGINLFQKRKNLQTKLFGKRIIRLTSSAQERSPSMSCINIISRRGYKTMDLLVGSDRVEAFTKYNEEALSDGRFIQAGKVGQIGGERGEAGSGTLFKIAVPSEDDDGEDANDKRKSIGKALDFCEGTGEEKSCMSTITDGMFSGTNVRHYAYNFLTILPDAVKKLCEAIKIGNMTPLDCLCYVNDIRNGGGSGVEQIPITVDDWNTRVSRCKGLCDKYIIDVKRVIMEGLLNDNAKITKRVANALQDDDEERAAQQQRRSERQRHRPPEQSVGNTLSLVPSQYTTKIPNRPISGEEDGNMGQAQLPLQGGGTRKRKKKKRRRRKTKRNRKRRKNKHSRKRKRKRRRKRKTRRN
jgi:hypothetical protein